MREHRVYGFKFTEGPQPRVPVQLLLTGYERQASAEYNWDGLKRGDRNRCLFQYTLSGRGALRVGDRHWTLRPGQGFLAEIPSDHHYYWPTGGEPWEFVWVILQGDDVFAYWRDLMKQFGPVVECPVESGAIRQLWRMHDLAAGRQIRDGYEGSALAYRFVTELYRTLSGKEREEQDRWPDTVEKVATFIRRQYARPIGIEELAAEAGLSKYHFARLFRQATGQTPIGYLTKVRMEEAVRLLQTTDLPVRAVAGQVGFASGNYFCKVFRQMIGLSPGQFRSGKAAPVVDEFVIR